jgi:hypothetical protein
MKLKLYVKKGSLMNKNVARCSFIIINVRVQNRRSRRKTFGKSTE